GESWMEEIQFGELYGRIALSQACRLLGLGDRDKDSPTYGCFDRYYWHYRQVDFVNSRFQEASQFLALLYMYNHPQNRFFQKKQVKEWACAAVNIWENIQRRDGSFDEYWPFERSFCVTSFTLYATAETCRLLACPAPENSIRKACAWLARHENPAVLNQMAASAVALRLSAELLQDAAIENDARRRMDAVLDRQDALGYFAEYGGFDIGYLTITLSCLAKYYLHAGDERVKKAMAAAFRFLDGKIFANGSFDYRHTSRQTQYFYPFAFLAMKEWEILSRHRRGLQSGEVPDPSWMDDRYCLPLAIDYLQTAVLEADLNP
ncbi:MAG: hypothetical protein AB1656_21650, partial [Candidatus Omnitrophota bacterium]